MIVTATQFKARLTYYLSLASREDVYVAKNGKVIAKITGVRVENVKSVSSLFGILPSSIDEKALLEERTLRI